MLVVVIVDIGRLLMRQAKLDSRGVPQDVPQKISQIMRERIAKLLIMSKE